MEIKVLQMTSETKALELAEKVKSLTGLLDMDQIDEAPVEFEGAYYVRFLTEMDLSDYAADYVGILEKKPEEAALENKFQVNQTMNEEGFATYTRMISDVQLHGGLDTSIDVSMLKYGGMTEIRNMLKDGLFTWALRAFVKNIAPTLPAEQAARYTLWLEELCLKYGAPQPYIDQLKVAESI